MDRGQRTHSRPLAAILLAGVSLSAASSAAAGAHFAVMEISDRELSTMRGRFVSSGQVQYFGIQMYTEWKTDAGEIYNAGLDVRVDAQETAQPTVRIASTADAGGTTAPATSADGRTTDSGGFDQVQGVGQIIQVAGDGNGVSNVITLDINQPQAELPTQGTWQEGFSSTTDAESGVSSGVVYESGGIGIQVEVPGAGSATQMISSTGIQQAVSTTGNTNEVVNRLTLSVQFAPIETTNTIGIRAALDSLRGIPR